MSITPRPSERRSVGRLRRRGSMVILTMIFLVLFTTLAVAFSATTNLNLRQARNYKYAQAAQLAAESSMQFATVQMRNIVVEGASSPDMIETVADTLAERLHGTPNLGSRQVVLVSNIVDVPEIDLSSGSRFRFTVAKVDDTTLRLTVEGTACGVTRRMAMNYEITEDTSVLQYAVASRSRIFVTDGATVDGDLCSTWDRTEISGHDIPPFLTEVGTTINGMLKTPLTEQEFLANDSDAYVEGDDEGMSYEEPSFSEYTTDDFDTADYKAALTPITSFAPTSTIDSDPFPSSTNIRRRIDRPVYENMTFDNIVIPTGHNPKFVNCTFNRVTYVDTNETTELGSGSGEWSHSYYEEHAIPGQESRSQDRHNSESNNVIFENCSFNGPVVTAVPRDYWWSKNALTFEGDTTFNNTHMPESTIMAPNFGVDIGGRGYDEETNPNSTLTGIIVGGIVDVRGTANIEGTILSMYYPDADRGSAARYYGTNIGFLEDGGETQGATGFPGNIRIVPQPDNVLPFGMQHKYSLAPEPDSYVEVN